MVFWLLVSAFLGGGVGLAIAHRPGGVGSVDASAPVVVARANPSTPAPQLVYWNVRRHLALDLQQPGLHPLGHSVLASHTLNVDEHAAAAAPAPPNGEVVTFSSGPRRFAVESNPGDGGTSTTGTDTTPTTSTTPPPPVNTTPIEISDVRTLALSPFSATIAWHTSEAVSSRISYGLDGPTLWTPATDSVDHTATVSGLAWSTTYKLWVNANATDGRSATLPYALTTPELTDRPAVSTGNGSVLLDGQLVFPSVVMGACPEAFPQLLADGVNFFEDSRCDNPSIELSTLAGRGFLIDQAVKPHIPGAVASFLPDEWDTFLPTTLTADQTAKMVPNRGGGPRFLTLTNHFYNGADPLPQGRGMYPALIANADILSFDLYPLQNWCKYDGRFHDVFDSQRELVALGGGKPTFQWIEARHMDCKDPVLDPTPQTVRAETWLSIAGGAHGIGYFPYDWSADIGAEIAQEKTEIETLAPALVDQGIDASANDGSLRVGARQHNGAVYVIAVNGTRSPVTSTINVPALANRALTSLDGTRTVTASNGSFTDSFGPLEVHIYISAPPTS